MKSESNSVTWNLWHGCRKLSAGCQNCYVYRTDARYDRDSSKVRKTSDFNLPVRRARTGEYKIPPKTLVYTCFTSDFLLEDADEWRDEAWGMIRQRSDLRFLFVTKRIDRLEECLPDDWGEGYEHVQICCTVENQDRADHRLPIFLKAPIRHKSIVCEPLLGPVNLSAYLGPEMTQVIVGGESGSEARVCDYAWVLDLRRQCVNAGVNFIFKQTGANFLKDSKRYRVPRNEQHRQARKAGINFIIRGEQL